MAVTGGSPGASCTVSERLGPYASLGEWSGRAEWIRLSDTYSHIDALCHVAFEGNLYNGHRDHLAERPVHGIEALKDGLVGHGVLLDIPAARCVLARARRARAPR